MLAHARLDAVIVATPMHLHACQSILALQQDLHVFSEVTAGVSLEECQELVQACRASKGLYMMAENCVYCRPNVVVRELVRQGLFGTTYYAEGEYLHELKQLNESTPWRRRWQTGIDGITYGTHGLGPVLQWMPGDRVVAVCCAGSGHHYRDPRGQEYAQDTSVMLGRMHSGGLVKIRADMLSDRPSVTTTFQLQGTDGCYESGRAPGEKNRIWLRSRCPDPHIWLDLVDLEEEFLPDRWRTIAQDAARAGHGGGDYFEMVEFLDAIREHRPAELGIHEAMDVTLPGLVSQQSILQAGQWLPVPDSRRW
jgi:predicted dehydrogenase